MRTTSILLLPLFATIVFGQTKQGKKPSDFIPENYVLFEKINGDLDKDGIEDCVLIIKATDKSKFFKHKYDGELDRNRRGILVLLHKKNHYELVVKNDNCFSSENEDGGVYFPPELSVLIEKGNLIVHYGHGRYGYWKYTFRFKNLDFDLIGYDISNGGVVISDETSINFLTKKKLQRLNINKNDDGGQEIFKDSWTTIKQNPLIKLSDIKDFDELNLGDYE